MPKYLKTITVALLAVATIVSCKKDSESSKPTCKIITASGASGQSNYGYNSDRELISISTGAIVTTLAYSGNTLVTITTNGGVFSEKKIITLNSNKLATSARIESNLAGTKWENYVYEYSGDEIIKQSYTTSVNATPVVSTLTWSGGNLITITSPTSTTTFGYYTDKPAKDGDYLMFSQLQSGYEIVRNKNAVKSILAGANISNFDYIMDADGKITSLLVTGATSTTFNYQYQCN